MSTLQCANIHFESTANNRVQYNGSNDFIFVAGGSNAISVNTTAVLFATGGSNTFSVNSTSISVSPGGTTVLTVNSTGVFDSIGNIRGIPVNGKAAIYELTAGDVGDLISTSANVTVNGAVLTTGTTVSVYNNSAANVTITSGTGVTMYLAGTANTSNRTLLQRGLATIVMVASNTFVISGAGLT